MIQALRSSSGFIAILLFFIAAGTLDLNLVSLFKTLICVTLGLIFAVISLHEVKELGFFN